MFELCSRSSTPGSWTKSPLASVCRTTVCGQVSTLQLQQVGGKCRRSSTFCSLQWPLAGLHLRNTCSLAQVGGRAVLLSNQPVKYTLTLTKDFSRPQARLNRVKIKILVNVHWSSKKNWTFSPHTVHRSFYPWVCSWLLFPGCSWSSRNPAAWPRQAHCHPSWIWHSFA